MHAALSRVHQWCASAFTRQRGAHFEQGVAFALRYRGLANSKPTHQLEGLLDPRRIFISGQKRGVFGTIKPELRRRSAIEPVIGHMKAEGHLGRCYLKGRAGDAANAILSAVGYNFQRILAWLRLFCPRS
jgi:hypothetical protein